MRHPVSTRARAERRAAPKPPPGRETWQAFVPSLPAQAGMEPQHSLRAKDRPMYPSGKGLQ